MPLQPQQALEQACADAILGATALGYTAPQVARTFDGRPPASCGVVFVAVWSDGRRTKGPGNGADCLDQVFGVAVTVTVRLNRPLDRMVVHRDDIEARLNAIVAILHQDRKTFAIINAANVLAGYRNSGVANSSPAGFCEGMCFDGTDAVREVDGLWFNAHAEKHAGLAQTARFAKARHVQSTMAAQ